MSQPLHHPYDDKTYNKGANSDLEKEFVGRGAPGTYVNAQNMRPEPIDGEQGALSKIKGELLLYPGNEPGASTYICLLACEVSGKNFQCWANTDVQYPPLVMIDGIVMVKSHLLPWVWDKPFQWAKVDDCDEGIVMLTDDNSIPMQFSVKDITTAFSQGLDTYFDDFDPSVYYINPTAPVERPEFLGLSDVGAGGGLPVGQYAYSLRFVDADGNATNWGPDTPLVSIPVHLGSFENVITEPGMPGASLEGGEPADPLLPSRYGARLRWRINNIGNYARIELRRKQINVGQGISTAPVSVLAHAINISSGINPYVDFTDIGTILETFADDETNTQALYVVKAKGVRYIDNRFTLANIEVAPKDVELTFRQINGKYVFAITDGIGKIGHHDPVNNTYRKSFIRGERYKFGIQLYDGLGGKSFVIPIPDDLLCPNRRDEKTAESLDYSSHACYAANVDNVVTPTFEALNMDDAIFAGTAGFNPVNIMVNGERDPVAVEYFAPVRPTRPTDGNKFGHRYNPTPEVRFGPDLQTGTVPFFPHILEPEFHALGAVFGGIETLPDWVSGWSVVRSAPAGRVISQGLASYKITSATDTAAPVRSRNKAIITFPDINTGIVSENVVNDFLANPSNFKLQCVAPFGFTSMQYGGVTFGSRPGITLSEIPPGTSYGISSVQQNTWGLDYSDGVSILNDQLSYARIMHDMGQVNPGYYQAGIQPADPALPGNQVGFCAWRNRVAPAGPFIGGGNNGNRLLDIIAVDYRENNGAPYFEVTLGQDLYAAHAEDVSDFMSNDTAAFHEPFYVCNLVQDGASIDASLIESWIPTGHYQRVRSIIGASNGNAAQEFILIDERIEDVYSATVGDYRYVWVNNKAWILSSNLGLNIAQVINAINQDGFWLSPDGTQVYGIYDVVNSRVRIGSFGINPPAGHLIEVRYNKLAPSKFFGGDCTISQNVSMPVNANSRLSRVYTYGDEHQTPIAGPPEILGISGSLTSYWFSTLQNMPQDFAIDNEGQTLRLSTSGFRAGSNVGLDLLGYQLKYINKPKMALPYAAYRYDLYYLNPHGVRDLTGGVWGNIQDSVNVLFSVSDRKYLQGSDRGAVNPSRDTMPGILRQWAIMFDCECRSANCIPTFEQDSDNQGWPHIMYVMRPFSQETGDTLSGNGVFVDYEGANAYGPGEKGRWNMGGFKWNKPNNFDYAFQPTPSSFSKPAFGYEEKTDLCNVIIWTPRVTAQIQNAPGYRTFPATNIRFIEGDTGGINKLYSAISSNGYNLFALTESGTCELLIGKNILTSADGNALATTRQDEFIGAEVWRSKTIGIPDMCWQLCGEGYWGNPKQDALFFADRTSAYALVGSQIIDIAKGQFRTKTGPLVRAAASSTIAMMNGWFDRERDEWGFSARANVRVNEDFTLNTDPSQTLVYSASPLVQGWIGEYTYLFDKVVHIRGNTYGMRGQETWLLDQGYVLNGEPIECWVQQASSPIPFVRKEWDWIKVSSIVKPTYVQFYDQDDNLVCTLDAALSTSLGYPAGRYLKNMDGWENNIPRRTVNRQRLQGSRMMFRVGHVGEEGYRLVGTRIQWKAIK